MKVVVDDALELDRMPALDHDLAAERVQATGRMQEDVLVIRYRTLEVH
jgi:hypothetical protein